MIRFRISSQRCRRCISHFSCLSQSAAQTSSLLVHKPKPPWNTNHTLVQSNPLLALLESCNSMTQLKQIQAQMIATGLILDRFSSSRLIAFCAISDAGDLSYAEKILKHIQDPSVVAWNFAIRGYSESRNPFKCIILYKELLGCGDSRPDRYTYPSLFKACSRLLLHFMGQEILGHVLKSGLDPDVFVCNGIIHMLVTCCELEGARKMFDEMCVRDLVSWNSLINGYAHRGRAHEALKLYEEMKREGVVPDEVTMLGLVSSTAQLEDLHRGKMFHQYIKDSGLHLTVPLCNALMDMYVKCGDVEAAEDLFNNMKKKTVVSWTTMVLGYAKIGSLDVAKKLFEEMPEKDVVPWNAMIGAYVQAKRCKEALALFHEMQDTDVNPDEVTMVLCLSACSQLGAIDVGTWIHRYVEIKKLDLNVALGTALIDMYAKCGNLKKALQVFEEMPRKNSLTWTAIIGGLAIHGKASEALSHFSKMIDLGLNPDEVTFLGVLSACCHGGMVDEGRRYFSQMTAEYKLAARLKHYSCMVDLLGRAGLLQEAEELINGMPIEGDAVLWSALFFSSLLHGNMLMGEKAGWKLLKLDPADSATYVMLSNMYREAKMWEEAKEVRKMMRERGVKKAPGYSSIEVNGIVTEFIVRDNSHPLTEQICSCLLKLTEQLRLTERAIPVGDYAFVSSDFSQAG